MMVRRGLARAALASLLLLAACGESGPTLHDATGVVEDVNREYGQVLISHEEVPGLMSAMTMNFDVPDPALLERLEKGQVIDFRIAFDGRSYAVVEATVRGTGHEAVAAAGLEDIAPEAQPAPPFALTDQAGETLSLEDLRGHTVLLDFVYTNCPGPCPILTGLHVDAMEALPLELRSVTRFVSITLDPERDDPDALRAYALARGADLSDWSFLTGDPEEVAAVVASYGVGTLVQPDGSIDHRLASFVIDSEGRIAHVFLGLDHDPEAIVRELARVARVGGSAQP